MVGIILTSKVGRASLTGATVSVSLLSSHGVMLQKFKVGIRDYNISLHIIEAKMDTERSSRKKYVYII